MMSAACPHRLPLNTIERLTPPAGARYPSGRDPRRGAAVPKYYWEDFVAGQVAEYGAYEVSADEIKAFAAEFDPQPMHLDEEAARASIVGGLCASGWHSCAIMMRIIADGFVLDCASMGATGCPEIKWIAPVRPGDRLRVRVKVLDTRVSKSRPGMGFVNARFDMLNAAYLPVMAVTTHMMLERRPAGRACMPARAA
jgi:acyl dehydratase